MDPYLGEIRLLAYVRVPVDWQACDGSLLNLNTYQALYSLLGTQYGGDGRTTFGVPDLRGRVPIGTGSGPNLTPRALGASGGTEVVALTQNQMPAHTHAFNATTAAANSMTPMNNLLGNITGVMANSQIPPNGQTQVGIYQDPPTSPPVTLDATAVSTFSGPANPHLNMMPSMAIGYVICTNGIYPTPN